MMRDKVRTENIKVTKRERERAINDICCNYKLRMLELLMPLRGLMVTVSYFLSRMVACGHKAHNPNAPHGLY